MINRMISPPIRLPSPVIKLGFRLPRKKERKKERNRIKKQENNRELITTHHVLFLLQAIKHNGMNRSFLFEQSPLFFVELHILQVFFVHLTVWKGGDNRNGTQVHSECSPAGSWTICSKKITPKKKLHHAKSPVNSRIGVIGELGFSPCEAVGVRRGGGL